MIEGIADRESFGLSSGDERVIATDEDKTESMRG